MRSGRTRCVLTASLPFLVRPRSPGPELVRVAHQPTTTAKQRRPPARPMTLRPASRRPAMPSASVITATTGGRNTRVPLTALIGDRSSHRARLVYPPASAMPRTSAGCRCGTGARPRKMPRKHVRNGPGTRASESVVCGFMRRPVEDVRMRSSYRFLPAPRSSQLGCRAHMLTTIGPGYIAGSRA
jgi:hypothetical protein